MKRVLGLDLGTNSIGWALVELDWDNQHGRIVGTGVRVIPMDRKTINSFESGDPVSQTAERTRYRQMRRQYQRKYLRRERLHRVLKILSFLPAHYEAQIDFEKHPGKFKKEVKLNYRPTEDGRHEFIFMPSFLEMMEDFKNKHPEWVRADGKIPKVPLDWTIYYLRKKALHEKITKEELAWIILHFNQKRGYYQLRGDELSKTDESKEEFYEKLTISEVIDTGEKDKKGGTWYEIKFENRPELVYRRSSKESLSPWVGSEKEFIITKSINKDGSVKYSFRQPKEDDWGLVKKRTEQEIEAYLRGEPTSRTVGSFIYDKLLENPDLKIRGQLIKTIERKYYKAELEAILNAQKKYHDELQDRSLYQKCIHHLYPHNENHRANLKDKDFSHLFVNDIIFYQRPLKSKKSTISNCSLEPVKFQLPNPDGEEAIIIPRKAAAKSNPYFQEYRIWQWISNLKIYKKTHRQDGKTIVDYDVTGQMFSTAEDCEELYAYLRDRAKVKQGDILNFLVKKKKLNRALKDQYRWNYPEDREFPMGTTRAGMLSRLKKVDGLDNPGAFLTREREYHLWHIIYSVRDAAQFEKALAKFADESGLNRDSFVQAFRNIPPYDSDYAAFSEKALKKLLTLMRRGKYWSFDAIDSNTQARIEKIITGEYDERIKDRVRKHAIHLNAPEHFQGLPVWLASYVIYDRHAESGDIQYWSSPNDIDAFLKKFKQHSLRNPIVEKVLLETLRVVRDIWRHYGQGEEGFFDEIHVELGREMKKPAQERKRIAKLQAAREKENQKIIERLIELKAAGARSSSPSHRERLKIYLDIAPKDMLTYKSWRDQKYKSPYTGQVIPLSDLFTEAYQIEHIIPQSRFFDDSLSNKVICESAVNELKGNLTAYEFIKKHGGEIVPLGNGKTVTILKWEEYENLVREEYANNRAKMKKLLAEEIPDSFIERQLNDTRYISRVAATLLSNIVREKDEQEVRSKNLISLAGSITARLRRDWGLEDKWNHLILPRFERMEKIMNPDATNDDQITERFTYKNAQGVIVPTVPYKYMSGFNKKRIDHRHHALDALVVAICTRRHIQYINSLENEKVKYELQPAIIKKNDDGRYSKFYRLPWPAFPQKAYEALQSIIVSFKQNTRVINRTKNYYQKYVLTDGIWKKKRVPQEGKNFAVRKPMHKETYWGLAQKLKNGKVITTNRISLSDIKQMKHINDIPDRNIQSILKAHLNKYRIADSDKEKFDFEAAFSPEGITELNKNIVELNGGKPHKPIYKVTKAEQGSKFPLSDKPTSSKHNKYVEGAKGTNLFFAIYEDEDGERHFETIPFIEALVHQKAQAHLPKEQRTPFPVKSTIKKKNKEIPVKLLFSLSPNDLVYVPEPGEEKLDSSILVERVRQKPHRVYKMVSSTNTRAYFIPANVATSIVDKVEFSQLNKLERPLNDTKNMTKDICRKIETDRLGNVQHVF